MGILTSRTDKGCKCLETGKTTDLKFCKPATEDCYAAIMSAKECNGCPCLNCSRAYCHETKEVSNA